MIDTPKPQLVGRTSEVQLLSEAISAVKSGDGGILLVGGEAGIGKTTLVSHVLQTCCDVVKISCRCPGPGETTPYGPWREAFLNLRACGPDWNVSLLPSPFGNAPALTEPFEIALSLIDWFRKMTAPLVLIMDDLQWSDRASMDLLRHLSGRLQSIPLLVIGVYRSEALHRSSEIRRIFSDMLRTGSRRISLHELNRAEVEDWTRATIPHVDNATVVAGEIYRLTHGFPLFVAEILDELKANQGTIIPMSETVQQAIDGKLNLLDAALVPILEEAAQIGEVFPYRLLADISVSTAETVTTALEHAKQVGLLFVTDLQPDMFQFRHAIVRDHLMNRMIGKRLERCHQAIAQVLERTSLESVDAIAFHYAKAHDARCVQFLVVAGDQAIRVGAILDAEERYRQALESVVRGSTMHAEICLKLAFCLQRQGESEAAKHLETALELARHTGDRPLEAWVLFFLYNRAYIRGDLVVLDDIAALSTLQEQHLMDARYRDLERLFCRDCAPYPRIAVVHWSFLCTHGRLDEAQQLLEDIQQRIGDKAPQVLVMKTRMSALLGRLDETIAIARDESKAAYLRHDDRYATVLFTNYVYHTYLNQCDDPDKIDSIVQELLTLEQEIDERNGLRFMPKGYSASGFYHYTRGNWSDGRRNLLDYVLAIEEPDPLITWFAAVMLVETGSVADLDAVLGKLAPFRPTDPPPPSTTIFTWVHAIRAQAQLLYGDVDSARAWLEAAAAHPLSQVSKLHRPFLDIAWADYYCAIGDHASAMISCERALNWAKDVRIPWLMIKAGRRLSELLAKGGEYAKALGFLENAIVLAECCKFPYEAALCHLSTGRVWESFMKATEGERGIQSAFPSGQSGIAAQLVTAVDVFTRLGARELSEALKLLDGVRGIQSGPEDAAAPEEAILTKDPAVQFVPPSLTEREWEVAGLVASGLTDKEVAARLFLSPRTVDHHLRSIFRKLNVRNRAALTAYLSKLG